MPQQWDRNSQKERFIKCTLAWENVQKVKWTQQWTQKQNGEDLEGQDVVYS